MLIEEHCGTVHYVVTRLRRLTGLMYVTFLITPYVLKIGSFICVTNYSFALDDLTR